MDKPTRWLRVEVPSSLYDEIVKRAKADDRPMATFLRRHLTEAFPLCDCGPDPAVVCAKCTDIVFHGTEIRVDKPAEDFQVCVGGAICACPKCKLGEPSHGLTGESVHGTSPLRDGVQYPACSDCNGTGPCIACNRT